MYSSLLAIAATLSAVSAAATQGFNYGAVTRTGATKSQSDFEAEFSAAKGLPNTDGAFTSARLYTMIQAGSTSDPIAAIPAAISQDMKLFLGMWASSGDTTIKNEIAALTAAITKYGDDFTSRVNGISVGSEDLYRITPTGLMNDPNSVGAGPDEIVKYIKEVRAALADTALSSIPIGHVDTWTAWQNGSNAAVVAECDFLGMNTFPYFQTTESDNSIDNAKSLFDAAVQVTKSAGGGNKPVIITETGWPVEGETSAKAVPSKSNAKTYWDSVGCGELFGNVDVYWYTLVDANTDTANQPEFGVVGTTLSTTPLFDLTCPVVTSSSSSSTSATATGSGSNTQSTGLTTSTIGSSGTATTTGSGAQGSNTGSASSTITPSTGSASSLSGNKLALGAIGVVAAVMAML